LVNDNTVTDVVLILLLQDPSRNTQQPFFYLREFLDWLFSSCNGLLEPAKKTVYQDMSRPLAHYWISSSHNTYLTGGHQEINIFV
jgi:phosphatidylinositol phospholipase C gamma-1